MADRLAGLAELVGGEVRHGADLTILGAAPLADVRAGEITLVDAEEKLPRLAQTQAAAVVIPPALAAATMALPTIVVADPHAAFAKLVAHFHPPRQARRQGISPLAYVSPSAKLAVDVDVHAGASIGDEVEIGAGATIHSGAAIMAGCRLAAGVTVYPRAVLYENTVVGPRSIIHAGAVIGGFGFGYSFVEGRHALAPQLGHVELGADVEVGANTTIDRGTFGRTLIGEGTKIDNQVQIGHNCRIGRHNMLCSQVGIAGSTSTGDYVVMAGQVGVRDHVHIGEGSVLGAMSGVASDVPAGSRLLGIPATPEREQKLKQAALSKLPEMRRQMKQLEQTVQRLVERIELDETKQAA
ncbi:MAG: UDP-3-O-(3-hydroxymyristoyl)glucosamine N-acyltransferase [Pirellulales bacterium]|nr:UDP-3-O-(3-hydroxymyristoyl)glucosamine N-acyltransferase [Pirellulales bacterium]